MKDNAGSRHPLEPEPNSEPLDPEPTPDGRISDVLERWLESDEPKTIGALSSLIQKRSFALVLLLVMFPSSLPLPTGGLTHIFEAIAMVVAIQIVLGRRELWLPKRWMNRELGATMQQKAIPFMVRRVRWFERFARPRLAHVFERRPVTMGLGVVLLVFTVTAFVAPPFSGLDTLPSLGVVVISLGLIVGDAILVGVGCVLGVTGVALVIALGSAALSLF